MNTPTDEQAPHPASTVSTPRATVPGLGVGRLLREQAPRVIEIALGAPVAALYTIAGDVGRPRALVLADPGVESEQLERVIAAGELIDAEAAAVHRSTPPIPAQRRSGSRAWVTVAWLAGVGAAISATIAPPDGSTGQAAMPAHSMSVTSTMPAPVF